jgi:mRNA interferase HicA
VKKKDLEKALKKLGWEFKNHGGNHDIWSKGDRIMPIPRHREINEITAKGILKKAKL